MPGFLSIQNRDIYSLVEFSLEEVRKLNKAMNLMEIKFDGTKEEEKEAEKYFTKEFFPFFQELLKEMEKNAPNIK